MPEQEATAIMGSIVLAADDPASTHWRVPWVTRIRRPTRWVALRITLISPARTQLIGRWISGRQRPLLHPCLRWREQERVGIDAMGLAIDRLHATAGEIDEPLHLASVGAAGIEHHGLVAFHRLNQGLGVLELVRVEHQQLEATGPWVGGVHGQCSAKGGGYERTPEVRGTAPA